MGWAVTSLPFPIYTALHTGAGGEGMDVEAMDYPPLMRRGDPHLFYCTLSETDDEIEDSC